MENQDQEMLRRLLAATDEIDRELRPEAEKLALKIPRKERLKYPLANPTNTISYIRAKIEELFKMPPYRGSNDTPEQKARKLIKTSVFYILDKDPGNPTRFRPPATDIIMVKYRDMMYERLPKILANLDEPRVNSAES